MRSEEKSKKIDRACKLKKYKLTLLTRDFSVHFNLRSHATGNIITT
jgi:hypothetical protein